MKSGFKRTSAAILAALILASTGAATVAMTGVGTSVVFAESETTVATIGNNEYTTLAAAIEAATDGQTVTLNKDVTNPGRMAITGKKITLDMNDHKITMRTVRTDQNVTQDRFDISNGGGLNVIGTGTFDGSSTGGVFLLTGMATDATDVTKTTLSIGANIEIINNVENAIFIAYNGTASYGVEVDVYGSISSTNQPIYVNGTTTASSGNVPKITLHSGSKFVSTKDGMYLAGYAKTTIEDKVTIKADGGNAINIAAGELIINGGTITGGSTIGTTESVLGSISTSTCNAVYIKQHNTSLTTTVTINGGTFKAAHALTEEVGTKPNADLISITINDGDFLSTYDGAAAVSAKSQKTGGTSVLTITGGTFSSDPSAFVTAANTYVHKNSDTEYVVDNKAHTVSLSDATAYAGNAVTLTATTDCETTGTYEWYKVEGENSTKINDATNTASYTTGALSVGSYKYKVKFTAADGTTTEFSNTATVKVSNYPTTTTTPPTVTTNEDGSTTETTTKTENGATVTTATDKDANGNVTGSTETKEEKKSDGSTVTTETKKDADGKVTQTTETTVAKDTTTNTTTETTKTENADGTKITETVKKVDENNNVLTETTKETEVDKEAEQQKEVLTEKKEDGSVVKTTTTSSTKEGDQSATIVEEKAAENSKGSTVEQTTTTVIDTTGKTTSVTEEHKIDNVGNSTNAVITVEKDGDGNVQEATAEVEKTGATKENGVQATFTNKVVSQLKEAAGDAAKDLTITMTVKDENGDDHHSITAKVDDLTPNNTLYIYKQDENGNYVMVNAKEYTTDAKGQLKTTIKSKNDFVLLNEQEANAATKAVLSTVKASKTTASVKKSKTTTMKLDSGLNTANVKNITYKTSKSSVATVDKKTGKITAKKAGKATVSAVVTLKNGTKKTVKMTINVK